MIYNVVCIDKSAWSVITDMLQFDNDPELYCMKSSLKFTCSKDLIYNISKAASTEVRAKHNDFVKRGIFTDHTGLSCFSPVVNIMRHPLWGRNQVTAWSHISLLNCMY